MNVHDVMTRDIYAVAPDTSLETAARLLTSLHVTGAPVVGPGGKPVGVVTLADLVDPDRERGAHPGYPRFYRLTDGDLEEVGEAASVGPGCVADVMSPFVFGIEASAPLTVAAERMLEDGVHRLLVLEHTRLIGIVTSMDLLRGFVTQEG
jgi:CBS domain-containing protein